MHFKPWSNRLISRCQLENMSPHVVATVWPGLVCTCVDLHWLALALAEIKLGSKFFTINFGHPAQVNPSISDLNLF